MSLIREEPQLGFDDAAEAREPASCSAPSSEDEKTVPLKLVDT